MCAGIVPEPRIGPDVLLKLRKAHLLGAEALEQKLIVAEIIPGRTSSKNLNAVWLYVHGQPPSPSMLIPLERTTMAKRK